MSQSDHAPNKLMNTITFTLAGWVLVNLSFFPMSFAAEGTSLPAEPDSEILAHFKEPSLRVQASGEPAQQIRLLMFRSFHALVSIRAFMTEDGPRIRVARLSGKDGHPRETLDLENEVGISREQWTRLVALSSPEKARNPLAGVTQEQLAALETTDGSTWVLEVRNGNHYTRAEVRNPPFLMDLKQKGELPEGITVPDLADFVACCRYLLRFAPMDAEQIY